MDRRDLFKGIIGAAAASSVKAAGTPQKFAYCEICQAHHTASLRCLPPLTDKQKEVWQALHNPDIRMVLFSGGRGCGKSFVVDEWKKSLRSEPKQLHVRRGESGKWAMTPGAFMPGVRFNYVSADDANDLPPETVEELVLYKFYGNKVFLTATPIGRGMETIRRFFPLVGWNGPARYHVNAGMQNNPHLAREPRLFQART
jgi:hypothetical protein